jgi:hypothetical protein
MYMFLPLCVIGSLIAFSCTPQEQTVQKKPIEQVLKEHTDRLMSIEGVVGTAIGECQREPCIKVLVEEKTPVVEKRIPSSLDGWKVEIEEVGRVRAL